MRQSTKKRGKARRGPGIWFGLLVVLFVVVIAVAGYLLLSQYFEYKAGSDAYGELARSIGITSSGPASTRSGPDAHSEASGPPGGWPDVDFAALSRKNPDIAGWLILPGTEINYPVVRGTDNEYYLKRLFNKNKNAAGTLFFDARNQTGLKDANTVIYGHNMKDGSMFAAITRYKNQSYFDEHPNAYLLTPDGNYVIELFAGFVSKTDADSWQRAFQSEQDYAGWIERMRKKSTFTSPVQMAATDRCVTLSTCSYEYDDARYVVMGKLTRAQ